VICFFENVVKEIQNEFEREKIKMAKEAAEKVFFFFFQYNSKNSLLTIKIKNRLTIQVIHN
jgi:hypothetical protein